ncbi:NADPH-dependent FMN reductase [Methanocella sp. CWC-04]|uniref:NADPH-dependent FMN reductase n=1 Tax=Methanooceanicella nereidis TaxID=2052831 RepID=A0AAP2RBE6_9EURY|nr:flavodoxin family protein [Methanocella sp. CWC-04]MCD1294409.1 NADPH-dependent FMN reductase [Methanocella sp. CWC-04]
MKVLAIMGSPKGKGNGYKVVRRIEENMKQTGDVEFEYLFLKEANLGLCKGCFVCVPKGERLCPLKDDREKIEQKILDSDGVILSSPGYVFNVSWLMKNFIDRFAYSNHRLRFFNQKVLLVANSGGAGLEETLKSMRNALGGAKIVYELAVPTPPWPVTPGMEQKNEKKIGEASKKLHDAMLVKTLSPPKLNDYMRFKFLKTISSEVKEYLPADYEFYKDKEYYYDTKISLYNKVMSSILFRIAMTFMKDMGPNKEAMKKENK